MSADELFRLAVTRERQRGSAECDHIFEDGVLLFPVEEVGRCATPAAVRWYVLPQGDETIGLPVRQRVEQDRIHDAEDRGVRTDAKRERDDGNRRHEGMLPQHPNTVFQILEEC